MATVSLFYSYLTLACLYNKYVSISIQYNTIKWFITCAWSARGPNLRQFMQYNHICVRNTPFSFNTRSDHQNISTTFPMWKLCHKSNIYCWLFDYALRHFDRIHECLTDGRKKRTNRETYKQQTSTVYTSLCTCVEYTTNGIKDDCRI